jgi:hypothetical protein
LKSVSFSSFPVDDTTRLIKRLEFWTEQLIRISRAEESYRYMLADLGILIAQIPPPILPNETPTALRIKEKLIELHRQEDRTLKAMNALGAELFNRQTCEVIFEGGPKPGSYLSWLPGEPSIAWWRESKEAQSERKLLPWIDLAEAGPSIH